MRSHTRGWALVWSVLCGGEPDEDLHVGLGGEVHDAAEAALADEPLHMLSIRHVADDQFIALLSGSLRRGEKMSVVVLNADTGATLWQRDDYPWLAKTARTVLSNGLLVFEASTLNDHDAGNGIHVVAADTGKHCWSKNYPP